MPIRKSPLCKVGLKENIIKKDVFDQEIAICRELYQKNKGRCGWGKCSECGVPLLLYKLYKGKLIENKNSIRKLKAKVFKGKNVPE